MLSVCENREDVVREILNWAAEGEDDMAFKYNIIAAFEKERAEGKEEGKAEGRAEGKAECVLEFLEEKGQVPEELRQKVMGQNNLKILKEWLKLAARAESVRAFEEQISSHG